MNSTLTVVVTSSYIPSHPSVAMISRTLGSLEKLGIGRKVHLIIAQDAPRPGFHSGQQIMDYQAYLQSLPQFMDQWPNLEVLVLPRWGHINGVLRHAIERVRTEYVLVVQHDLEFVRELDLRSLLSCLNSHPEIKHVRFNKQPQTAVDWDAEYEYRNRIRSRRDFVEEVSITDGRALHHLVKTLAWSDNNYLCRKSYLTGTVFAVTGTMRVPPEHALNPLGSPKNHEILGTYIYGKLDETPYISHLDGRNSLPVNLREAPRVIFPWHHGISRHFGDARLRLEAQMRMSALRLRHREVAVSGD